MVTRILPFAIVAFAAPALAENAKPIDLVLEPSDSPLRVHHAPPSTAKPHEPFDLEIEILSPHLVKKVVAIYRAAPGDPPIEVAFLRTGEGYVARIPAEHVNPPGLSYAIELETLDGKRVPVFATRTAMHPVQVPDDLEDLREHQLLGRPGIDGHRSVVLASFDYVDYGRTNDINDYYWRSEAAYFYRPLRFVVEFGFKVGVVRGTSPVAPGDHKVGLNYGSPSALFRVADLLHFEVSGVTSITEVGFSGGIGGAIHIGDVYGSKLVIGGETVKTFGSRGWARLDIARGRMRVSPVVEVGDIPNAKPGVRLFTELGYVFANGWVVSSRFGYQARDFANGGLGGGGALGYAF
ncbi:MAG: hypothetical protein ACXWUG_31585 [Polyangiales bacterium]